MEYAETSGLALTSDLPHSGAPAGRLPRIGGLERFKKASYVVAAMLVAALAVVALLGRWARSPAAAARMTVNPAVDAMLMQLGPNAGTWLEDSRVGSLSALLKGEAREAQVPPAQVRCTAMVFGPGFAAQTQPAAVVVAPIPFQASDPRAEEAARMNAVAEKLQLESILIGTEGPSAVISGATVMEGQEIEGWVVKKILPKKAVLAWKEYTFTLSLR